MVMFMIHRTMIIWPLFRYLQIYYKREYSKFKDKV